MQNQIPLFEENVNAALETCTKIFKDRGVGYTDTWRDGKFNAVRATQKIIQKKNGLFWDNEDYRTIVAAALVDVKISRLAGEYKEDTPVDLINYLANWVSQMRKISPKEEDQRYPGDKEPMPHGWREEDQKPQKYGDLNVPIYGKERR